MRQHGYRFFRGGSDWWLLCIFIILYPIIGLAWISIHFPYVFYPIAFGCGVAEGKSLREAHEWAVDDIKSMVAGSKYGGM